MAEDLASDLWIDIFNKSGLPKLSLRKLLPLRTVCKIWNQVICAFPKVCTTGLRHTTRLTHIFTSLRHLSLQGHNLCPDWSLLPGLNSLELLDYEDGGRYASCNMAEFAILTNLKKLSLASKVVTSLGPLTGLTSLDLRQKPFRINQRDCSRLPFLTRLTSEDADFFQKEGHGIITLRKEIYYEGGMKDGKKHGMGTQNLLGRGKYSGRFEEGVLQSPAVVEYPLTGNRYEGQVDGFTRRGQGKLYFQNGDVYQGEFFDTTQGQWSEGAKSGKGVLECADGTREEGEWQDGHLVTNKINELFPVLPPLRMKRPLLLDTQGVEQKRSRAQVPLVSFEDIVYSLPNLKLTASQLRLLSQQIDGLYSDQVNLLTQEFPSDLWFDIFQKARLPKLPLDELVSLRTVCRGWNKTICQFPKVSSEQWHDVSGLAQIFPSLRHLSLHDSSFLPLDFNQFTGLQTLELAFNEARFSDVSAFTALTNLTKLTLTTHTITSLDPLTSLRSLALLSPVGIDRSECLKLPLLTRLVSEDPHFFIDEDQGIVIDEDKEVIYEGGLKDGYYHGMGVRTFHSRGERLFGEFFMGGIDNGPGVIEYFKGKNKGDRYEGQISGFSRHGLGTLVCGNGDVYHGEFEEDRLLGRGTMVYANGDKYIGEMVGKKRDGLGDFLGVDGTRESGYWDKDKLRRL